METITGIENRIAYLREILKITQDSLADLLDIGQANLSHIEKGIITPSFEIVFNLCMIFDIHVDWLVLDIGEPPEKFDIKMSMRYNDLWEDCYYHPKKRTAFFKEMKKNLKQCIELFTKRLKMRRRELNITQEKIAQKLSLARTSYTGIEAGRSVLNANQLKQLSEILDVSLDWLLFGIIDKENQHPVEQFKSGEIALAKASFNESKVLQYEKENQDNSIIDEKNDKTMEKAINLQGLTKEQIDLLFGLVNQFRKLNALGD